MRLVNNAISIIPCNQWCGEDSLGESDHVVRAAPRKRALRQDENDQVNKRIKVLSKPIFLFNLTYEDNNGNSYFHYAAMNRKISLFKFCHEVDPELFFKSLSKENKDRLTPLYFAAKHGHLDLFKYLHQINPELLLQHISCHVTKVDGLLWNLKRNKHTLVLDFLNEAYPNQFPIWMNSIK